MYVFAWGCTWGPEFARGTALGAVCRPFARTSQIAVGMYECIVELASCAKGAKGGETRPSEFYNSDRQPATAVRT